MLAKHILIDLDTDLDYTNCHTIQQLQERNRTWLKTAREPFLFAMQEQTIFDLVGDPQDVVQI